MVDDEAVWPLRMWNALDDHGSDGFCGSTHNSMGHMLLVFQEGTLKLHAERRQGFPVGSVSNVGPHTASPCPLQNMKKATFGLVGQHAEVGYSLDTARGDVVNDGVGDAALTPSKNILENARELGSMRVQHVGASTRIVNYHR